MIFRWLLILAVVGFTLDVTARLLYGAWLHESRRHQRRHRRYRQALEAIAGTRLVPSATAFVTEGQLLQGIARTALAEAPRPFADPRQVLDEAIGTAMAVHRYRQGEGYEPTEGEHPAQRPPTEGLP